MSYYTVKEISELFRVSGNTIRRHIADGTIQAVRVGESMRIPASELERLQSPIKSVESKQ